ncbi:MAG: PAS domain S-box protein [Pseudomonadota bacterium]
MNPDKLTKKQLISELQMLKTRIRELEAWEENREKVTEATEHKLAVQELHKSNLRLDLLAETSSQLLRSETPQDVVDSLCHKVLTFLDCQAFFNYLVDHNEKRLYLNAYGGIPEKDAKKMEWLDYGVGLCGCSAREGRKLVVENLQNTNDQYTALVRPFGIQAYACHPLISKDNVLGTLSFCARNRNKFSEDELSLMQAVTDQVAIAIDRKQIEEKLKKSHVELQNLVTERTAELDTMVVKLRQEIKERERTEQELRKSQERYSIAIDGSSSGVWDIDLVKGDVFYSPRWKKMLGYEDNEISSRFEEWETRIHPDDYTLVIETRKNYLEGLMADYDVNYRLRHKNGSYRWFHERGACLRDSQGKPFRMAGSYIDITERKMTKGALMESEKRYRELFEESKDTVFIINTSGRLVDINPAGSELLGYTKEELFAMDFVRSLHINKKARLEFRKKLLPDGFVKDAELELKRKDCGTVVVHVSASLMHDSKGKLTGFRGIAHDVTERKKLEQQLLRTQKMESIGLLAGGVAHEFNNLLTAIIGFADELEESVDRQDDRSQSNIRTIQSAANQAAKFTQDLLTFSRQQVMDFRPVAVNGAIEKTLKLLYKLASENVRFTLELSPEMLTVLADSGQLSQVVMNLTINANDSMPEGGEIRIKTWHTALDEETARKKFLDAPGDYVVISFSDSGKGMAEKTMSRIFEPFFTTKKVGEGSGLGLFIVYGIIKQHKGSILAESTIGEGTSFTIFLPRLYADILPAKHTEARINNARVGTILVAEDEEFVRNYLESTLSRAGYRLIFAEDGEAALTKFRQHRDTISLVISDMVMPKMSGRILCEEIRKITPEIKMILMSGYSADATMSNGVTHDRVRFISKPFLKKILFDTIDSMLASE